MDYNLVLTWKGKNKLVLVYKKRGLFVCLFVCFFAVRQHVTSRIKNETVLLIKEDEFQG